MKKDRELRKRVEESEHKLGLSMPLDEAKQRATLIESEITSLERYNLEQAIENFMDCAHFHRSNV